METNNPTLEDLAAMLTNQLQQDSKHKHVVDAVRQVGKRTEYKCRECGYTYQANH